MTDALEAMPAAGQAAATPVAGASPGRGRVRRLALLLVLVLVLAAGGAYAWRHAEVAAFVEETDNAYVGGNQVFVSPQLSGTVKAVRVDETAIVKEGDVLVELDDVDAQIGWDQARAALGAAARQIAQAIASAGASDDVVRQREVDLRRAEGDLKRREGLETNETVAAEELVHARDSVEAARAALTAARSQAQASRASVAGTQLRNHPAVLQAAAVVEQAYVTQQRSRLLAPTAGVVARRTVQVGQRVAAGTNLLAVVPLSQLWVDANFKENQLANLRLGQAVSLTSDAYGAQVVFRGRVLGLGAGTGSAFAALPAQNATGNWIKVVQRLPVRVALEPDDLREHPLRVGLSMAVNVDTHRRDGPGLQEGPAAAPAIATRVNQVDLAPARAEIERIVREAAAGLQPASAAAHR